MNRLTLAVAGGRKTQSIVDACARAPAGRRILVLTYTQRNQGELAHRLATRGPLAAKVDVQGWFSFLLGHLVRPYLPCTFPGRRLNGLNFDGDPGRLVKGARRFLDTSGRAYKRHLARLAHMTIESSDGAAIDRVARIYDHIWIDEVQDLNGYDLEILIALMAAKVDLHMVGDIRQAILQTNTQDPKNKQFKGVNIKTWFDEQARKKRLEVFQTTTTWRCNPEIATFADSIFDPTWGFSPTESRNHDAADHSGILAVDAAEAEAYAAAHSPLCLRYSVASWKQVDLPFINIGLAKGMGSDHVLIAPTNAMLAFIESGKPLEVSAACSLYVAVTRARHSLAFLSKEPSKLGLPVWQPPTHTHKESQCQNGRSSAPG
jgi:hypothetical protein